MTENYKPAQSIEINDKPTSEEAIEVVESTGQDMKKEDLVASEEKPEETCSENESKHEDKNEEDKDATETKEEDTKDEETLNKENAEANEVPEEGGAKEEGEVKEENKTSPVDPDVMVDKEEEICFESRARIYRYNTQKSSWKERGTGKVQIMMHKTSGRVRIIMRRDLTFIVCCNHFITPEMYLKPLPTSANTFTWCTAADHYDGETNPEVLAIKLSKDNLTQFEIVFNYAVNNDLEGLKASIQKVTDSKQTTQE